MATIAKPEMPILRETPDQIYQRIANRMKAHAEERGETPPATEEGEIFYDLLYPLAEEISEQQQLLEYAFLQGFLPWADGEFLQAHGYLLGLEQKEGEDEEAYRNRLIERARTEEGNGRRSDYEQWARQVAGVGGAVAIEKERHDLSVDVYITGQDGQPVTEAFAQQVRNGMEAKRVALHDLQVHPAVLFPVGVEVKLLYQAAADQSAIVQLITKRIQDYLKGRTTIMYQQIGALFFVDGVVDYTGYTLNGGEANLTKPANAVSTLSLAVVP
ncbi:baseplate J/gp47 family protein [Brevibacillus fluminis]|uniref:baseplate J/gp47 family protein n=1 Tax=Brevibacillus fluminis TaxID=511487 RepID=UPI003F8CA110